MFNKNSLHPQGEAGLRQSEVHHRGQANDLGRRFVIAEQAVSFFGEGMVQI
jgi:hypothetical protein